MTEQRPQTFEEALEISEKVAARIREQTASQNKEIDAEIDRLNKIQARIRDTQEQHSPDT